ncbi:MAG: hypothetical protein ACJAT1_002161 [Marivirga sp.]|jgi:hypothetical protein
MNVSELIQKQLVVIFYENETCHAIEKTFV